MNESVINSGETNSHLKKYIDDQSKSYHYFETKSSLVSQPRRTTVAWRRLVSLQHVQFFVIHPTDEGRIVSMQVLKVLDNVDGILTAQGSVDGVRSYQSRQKAKP
jgi:hypothetical protein